MNMQPLVAERAENLIGSEIIKLAGEVNALIAGGKKIYNLTIGDFDPKIFPIPNRMRELIEEAYQQGQTNYPPADGIAPLRTAIGDVMRKHLQLDYSNDEILVAGGGRPLIYALFQCLVDAGDTVVFPVPSWNNNHYTYLAGGKGVSIETTAENNFMPSAAEIAPYISEAALVAVCSPLNPTGTVFTKEALGEICTLIIEENEQRAKAGRRPVYLLYDQMYWTLTADNTTHYTPVSIDARMRDYTIFVDGISKAFAATGVRVGWSLGPKAVIGKMKTILGHIGAWAPKAEQVATAKYFGETEVMEADMEAMRKAVHIRLERLYDGFVALKKAGLPVDVIYPEAAIYLTVRFPLVGKITPKGQIIEDVPQATAYLLQEAGVAIVPFYAFGASTTSDWYRVSVGTLSEEAIPELLDSLREHLSALR